MRILVTSDWQACLSNLSNCQRVVEEVLKYAKMFSVDAIINCGDLKEVFNPVDQQVTNFLIRSTSTIASQYTYIVLLGNHDRSGLSDHTESCLPVVSAAGAKVVGKPKNIRVDNWSFHFVPFMRDLDRQRQAFIDSARLAKTEDESLLFFHAEVSSLRYNVYKRIAGGVSLEDVSPDSYMYCVGGHIHCPQHRNGLYYVGSPFPQDWTEVNQEKGYLYFDLVSSEVKFLRSSIPGYYDPTCPGFNGKRFKSSLSKHGAVVRVWVDRNWSGRKEEAFKRSMHRKYPGASLYCVAKGDPSTIEVGNVDHNTSDIEAIREHLSLNVPPEPIEETETYLESVLSSFQDVRGSGLIVKGWEGVNFLSFERLSFRAGEGTTLVTGGRDEGLGESNGCGKTNFLQALIVAISGRSMKGQVNDEWANTNTTGRAYIRLFGTIPSGQSFEIYRQRRPHKLVFKVNGRDWSAGRGTQAVIDKVLGVGFKSISNSVYVDQQGVSDLLVGNDSKRKGMLGEFLGLHRFGKASEVVKSSRARAGYMLEEAETLEASARSFLKSATKVLKSSESLKLVRTKEAKLLVKIKRLKRKLSGTDIGHVKGRLKVVSRRLRSKEGKYNRILGEISSLEGQLRRIPKGGTICPVCGKRFTLGNHRSHASEVESGIENKRSECSELSKVIRKLYTRKESLELSVSDLKSVEDEIKDLNQKLYNLRRRKREIYPMVVEAEKARKAIRVHSLAAKGYRQDIDFYNYCIKALSKDGVQASLARMFCKRLNSAGEYYSELFSGGDIKVKFVVPSSGELDVQVANVHGGSGVKDQSKGELRLASLPVSFSLRETAIHTNILILDEPGDGLDEVNAKRFCKGLSDIASRFGTVLVTTHNAHIQSSLRPDRHLRVRKSGMFSRVEE